MLKRIILLCGAAITLLLLWFAISNYQASRPIAEETLFGLAHSLHAAIENSALHDPSLHSLSTFHTPDIAYFALVDRKGVYRFHSNPELTGTFVQDKTDLQQFFAEEMVSKRIKLTTGEEAYELINHLHLPSETLGFRIVLHTYRADAVVRRAEFNMLALFSLLIFGWILAFAVFRFTRREEQHKFEMARRESLAQLGEMGAMLAHEIRNPLAGIKGYAQVIGKKPQDERNSGFAERIVTEAHRLEILVSDLLEFARSEQESMVAVDLAEVVSHTADLLRHEAEQFQININCESPATLPLAGNRDSLAQVLLNLGKNAIQAMPDGGTMGITAEVVGKQAIITVSDNGQGISQEELPRIFEPFFTTKARGTGLGLSLCRKIVEEHGGQITVKSTVGQGTSVSITIPVRQRYSKRS